MQQKDLLLSFPELTDEQKKRLVFYVKRGIYLEMHCLGLINDEQLSYLFELIDNV